MKGTNIFLNLNIDYDLKAWCFTFRLLSILDHVQHAGGHQCGLQGDSTISERQQLSGPHPVLPGWAGHT